MENISTKRFNDIPIIEEITGNEMIVLNDNNHVKQIKAESFIPKDELWENGNGTGAIKTKEGNNIASDDYAIALGHNTKANGESSHSSGQGTEAIGIASHAEGLNTIANSNYSHVEGIVSKTVVDDEDIEFYGYASHAEGAYTTAKGAASHAEGDGTLAIGMHSHAEGRTTTTGGDASHAEGSNTITNNLGEHAEGVYNFSNMVSPVFGNAGNTLHSIGFGSATEGLEDDRKNAFEVMQNGDIYIYGLGGYDGTNVSEANTLQSIINTYIINIDTLVGSGVIQ